MKKWGLTAALAALVVAGGGVIGFRIALGIIKGKVVAALGPESEIKELTVGWSGVEVLGLRIRGRPGWPAPDTLRTERVVIVPSLWSLLSGTVRVSSITVYRPYLSALRTKDGRLRLVPSLLERPAQKGRSGAPAKPMEVAIGRIRLEDGVVELFDATVAQPPHKIRLEQIQATLKDLRVPSLKGKSGLDVAAIVKGVRQDGKAKVTGWAEVATSDCSIETELRALDLLALQPYIAKSTSAQVQKGTMDLTMRTDVSQNRLKAPGQVVIADLELSPSRSAGEIFLGVPRDAVLGFMKGKDNRIALNFVIEGDLNNPQFSLNEALNMRMAAGMAEMLGVGIGGLARGLGTLGIKGGEATGEAIKGLGGALKGLFGGQKKP
jgi:hypothetical protein